MFSTPRAFFALSFAASAATLTFSGDPVRSVPRALISGPSPASMNLKKARLRASPSAVMDNCAKAPDLPIYSPRLPRSCGPSPWTRAVRHTSEPVRPRPSSAAALKRTASPFTIFETRDVSVQVVRVGPDGSIYAATVPGGKVYKLNPNATAKQDESDAKTHFRRSEGRDRPARRKRIKGETVNRSRTTSGI